MVSSAHALTVAMRRLSPISLLLKRFLSSRATASARSDRLVLGCGSNVVDHIYRVRVVPSAGTKGFFSSPFKALEKRLIGGVTLNHLCWAALGGVDTGLLALQGNDELGQFVRERLIQLNVDTTHITTDDSFSTAQCHVFIQDGGERSIMMAPAATSLINDVTVRKYFDDPIRCHASMVTTEISQVPISGVIELLKSAKQAGVLSILDLDIPPSVAEEEAELGSVEEVVECVKMADILKPNKEAAEELVSLMTAGSSTNLEPVVLAKELVRLCGSKLVAMTNGGNDSILASGSQVVCVTPPPVSEVVDTTGAGDAFLGGLIAGISREGGLPTEAKGLEELGVIANAFGATCTQSVGGVPTRESWEKLQELLPDFELRHRQDEDDGDNVPCGDSTRQREGVAGFQRSLLNDEAAVSSVVMDIEKERVESFVTTLSACPGTLYTSGIGKSGSVASRFAGSLSSIGIPSNYVHATEWLHGDLGKVIGGRDVVVFLSHSGSTSECLEAAAHLIQRGVAVLTITSNHDSELSRRALASLTYPTQALTEPFQMMPTSSIVLQEVLCNALLCELIQRRGVTMETFTYNHPGGTIGKAKDRSTDNNNNRY